MRVSWLTNELFSRPLYIEDNLHFVLDFSLVSRLLTLIYLQKF